LLSSITHAPNAKSTCISWPGAHSIRRNSGARALGKAAHETLHRIVATGDRNGGF
jgi:hypothetical protein